MIPKKRKRFRSVHRISRALCERCPEAIADDAGDARREYKIRFAAGNVSSDTVTTIDSGFLLTLYTQVGYLKNILDYVVKGISSAGC